jgi:hypothetical protein
MKKFLLVGLMLIAFIECTAQGFNHQWLIGDQWLQTIPKGRMTFDSTSYIYQAEYRKMPLNGTQGNICDANGNFLMSSNGVWIANANNDTMLNGAGLNPGSHVNSYPNGLYLPNANVFLPFPGDTTKYILVHHSAANNGLYETVYELLYSIVDITQDNGLGGVVLKNQIAFSDTLNWGLAACKHANGRDWWIVMQKDSTDEIYQILLTPDGVVNFGSQHLFVPPSWANVTQLTFSQDGTKLGYTSYKPNNIDSCYAFIADFDRCSGLFSNTRIFNFYPSGYFWGFAFSANSKFAFVNTSTNIFQLNIDSMTIDTVATYDGFSFPIPAAATTFMHEYLAANGKIYLTSGNGVQHLHEINYPDSAGLACDVQQHAVSLGVWHFRAVPNHPNYNLGPVVGSVCDTLSVGIEEIKHDFKFNISPNPTSDGYIKLVYLLPQNKSGKFEVYNITGQLVFEMNLPPWSTLQFVKLPELSNGVYTCVIRSGYERAASKLVLIR